MKIKGNVTVGPMRGKQLIEKFFFRLSGIIGYEPFKGTLDVRLENKIDIKLYATKTIDHILLDGAKKIDAYLAPIIVSAKGQDVADDAHTVQQVLEVVQHEEHVFLTEVVEQLLFGFAALIELEADVVCDGRNDEVGCIERRERREVHAVGVGAPQLRCGRFQCKARLAHAAGAEDGHEACVGVAQQFGDFDQFRITADERRRLSR